MTQAQRQTELVKYPAGALLRVKDICGDRKTGKPGILPIVPRTWLKWVEAGRVPQGVLLGPKTRAWRIETVLAACDALAGEGRQETPSESVRDASIAHAKQTGVLA